MLGDSNAAAQHAAIGAVSAFVDRKASLMLAQHGMALEDQAAGVFPAEILAPLVSATTVPAQSTARHTRQHPFARHRC